MTTHQTRGRVPRPRRRSRALLVGIAAAALTLTACGGTRPEGGATTVGVTDDAVKIGATHLRVGTAILGSRPPHG